MVQSAVFNERLGFAELRSKGIPIPTMEVGLNSLEADLGDSSVDFDFVVNDSMGTDYASMSDDERYHAVTFRALDGNRRTDTWLSNEMEVDNGTDTWDADTDDDGMTDGQELVHVIRGLWGFVVVDGAATYDTDPLDPDTDGDGYWDGWFGVYGAEDSENVVLYREHLQDGRGVTGDEIVQEQVKVHAVSGNTPGTDLYDNGTTFHSNLHIGERHWGTDPTNPSETPAASVDVEVDYHDDNTGALQSDDWRESIAANYALYGIDVSFVNDRHTDVITATDLQGCDIEVAGNCLHGGFDHTQPFTVDDIYWIQDEFHDTDSLYLFVGDVTDDPNESLHFPGQSGVRRHTGDRDETTWVSVFAHGNTRPGDFNEIPAGRWGLSHNEQIRALSLKTAVHEIGHVLNMGENEPAERNHGQEVYSGCGAACNRTDPTVENVEDAQRGIPAVQWSVMSSGSDYDQYLPPSNSTYVAFSIEEVSTASTDDRHAGGS